MILGVRNQLIGSAAAYRRAKQVIPGGLSRFLPMLNPDPVFLDRGTGAHVFDIDGNKYLDFNNNFTAIVHGHAHPVITAAVIEQAQKGNSFGSPTAHETQLAEMLCERIPGAEQVRFQNTGTEAVLVAIKAARAYTGRAMIAKLEGAYHGFYDYAEVSQELGSPLAGDAEAPTSLSPSTGTPAEVARQVLVLPFNDETAALELIRRHAHKLAAIVIDTMPSRAGMICMTSSFCQMLRDACSRYGIVLIDDEVMSLRSGYAGGLGNLGVQADLTALGKIIGGGLPIGAVAGSAEIMQVFSGTRGNGKVTSSGTYSANPVSLSAGIAALHLLTKEAIANMEEMAIRLREEGSELLGKVGLWPCVRGAGSLFKFVLKEGPISRPRESVMTKHEQIMQDTFVRAMLDRGIWITASGTACLSTAMTQADITTFLDAACESLELAKAV